MNAEQPLNASSLPHGVCSGLFIQHRSLCHFDVPLPDDSLIVMKQTNPLVVSSEDLALLRWIESRKHLFKRGSLALL
jgi:hypothetical protein